MRQKITEKDNANQLIMNLSRTKFLVAADRATKDTSRIIQDLTGKKVTSKEIFSKAKSGKYVRLFIPKDLVQPFPLATKVLIGYGDGIYLFFLQL